ncbi:lymphocyte antigen 75-like isoform X2 [Notolabrus celidotus]|uniref:lymphocyte antigen 75-like isoform X2 n=1 Tax=Notolabrus celidotus TaxID=1203425 RepID=UPI00148F8B02|nr:lymphocyte antigen 75-like isoform X2 [Notolabrus celidotus]
MEDRKSLLLTLCFLLTASLCMEAFHLKKSRILKQKKNFTEATLICSEQYVDMISLATVYDIDLLMQDYGLQHVWLNEHRDPTNSLEGETQDLSGDGVMPQSNLDDDEECSIYESESAQLNRTACSQEFPFVCRKDNLVLVKENKTWEDAVQHCKDIKVSCESWMPCKFGLLTLMQSDYDYVRSRIYDAETEEVWTGLRFLGGFWFWTDGQQLDDEGALPLCPPQKERCGTLSKIGTNNWLTRDCSEKRNFICARKMNGM